MRWRSLAICSVKMIRNNPSYGCLQDYAAGFGGGGVALRDFLPRDFEDAR